MRKTSWSWAALPLIVAVSGAAPATAAETAAKAATSKTRLVCKKLDETGSLVKKTKVCLTREQWTRSAENHEKQARDMADGLRTKPGGN